MLNVCLVIALAGAFGMTLQAFVEREQRARFPAPGELVDIGGGQIIHLRTWGIGEPGPTILLDAAATMTSSLWTRIGPRLGERHPVVAFDRPGLGWSSGPARVRDARSAADALALALDRAGFPPPFVVIGHSYGGFSARVFAGDRRDQVVGLALLDTTHPDGGGGPAFAAFYRSRAILGHTGLYQLLPPRSDFEWLPEEEREQAHASSLWTSHLDASAEELEAWDISAAQVLEVGGFGDLPLLIISAVGNERIMELQRDMVQLSTAGRLMVLPVSHTGMLVDPNQAALTIAAIEDFLREI